MALHLIYGRSGSGKTAYCLRKLTEHLQAGGAEPLLWLLPEHETFKMEKALAKALPERGFYRAYIVGFKRLAYRVLNECGGALHEHITELGKKLLVSRILNEHSRQWTAFARAARQRNFADVLVKLLEELKVYGINSAVLSEKAQELPDSDDLKNKLVDLALAFAAMEEKMANVYQDNEDCMDALIRRLPQSRLAANSHVYIDGFRFFNPQELAVIRVLLERSADVTVTLCIDNAADKRHNDETDIFYRQYRTRERLLKLAAECQVEADEFELDSPRRFRQPALAHIEAALYKFGAAQLSSADGVRIVEAANRRREIEGIAADILRLRRQTELRWRDIALLVRDGDAYYELIETVFHDYEIPFFCERKQATLHHPLAELLRSALEAVSGWNYEPLFRVFKTGFFPAKPAEIDLLENYVLACGIRGKKWREEEPWTYRPSRMAGGGNKDEVTELLAAVDDIRKRVAVPLIRLQDKLNQAGELNDALMALYELMEELDIAGQLEQTAFAAEKDGQLAEAASVRQVWDGVMTLLEQMADISGSEQLNREALIQLLSDGLDELTVSLIPPGIDYVTVAAFDQNSTADTRAVYIVGVNEGVIPRKAKTEGLLSDSDRLKLTGLGLELPAGVSADNFGERYLVYSAFSRAAEYLTVSYALADQNGDALLPSALLNRLRELLPIKTDTLLLDAGEAVLGKPKRSLAYLTEAFSKARSDAKAVPEIWQAVYNWGIEHDYSGVIARYLDGFGSSLAQKTVLPSELAQRLYLSNGRLRGSVTRFEEYRQCPFRHFADYGLNLQEREIFEWQVNELGSFLHAIMRLFGERLHESGRQWGDVSELECEQLCHELVQEIAPELKNQILFSSAYYQHLLLRIERAARKSLHRLIKLGQQSEFRPVGYEKSFGRGKELAPLTYTLKDGSILEVRGQIDRIDMYHDSGRNYLIVIDYKTGIVSLNLLEVYYGLKMQLLTYLLVACNAMQEETSGKTVPAGMLYCFLKTQKLSLDGRRSAAEIEQEIDKALKMPGWVLADQDIVKKFDALGRFLPIALDRKGEFTKASVRCIKTPAEFTALLQYIDKILTDTGELILSGDISVSPYQLNERNACEYCQYGAVCQYDASIENNAARALSKLSDEETLARIFSAVAGGGNES